MAIQIKKDGTEVSSLVDDNVIQPFSLEKVNVRGRVVRLGSALTDIMEQHKYPAPVAALLSEVVVLCAMLSAMIKYDGIFSLQVKSDGVITSMVADVTSAGEIRAYASFNSDEVAKMAKIYAKEDNHFYALLGHGIMSFTVKSNVDGEHDYQGIIELQGKSLRNDIEHYFEQSEQIRTSFKTSIHPQDGFWRAGGIMIQSMPVSDNPDEFDEEDWQRPSIMLASCTDDELLSTQLHSADILFRLFNEDGVMVYPAKPLRFGCQCSRQKVESILVTLPRDDIDLILEKDSEISVKCEFCSEEYKFLSNDIDEIFLKKEQGETK